jgi:hypothetical protein
MKNSPRSLKEGRVNRVDEKKTQPDGLCSGGFVKVGIGLPANLSIQSNLLDSSCEMLFSWLFESLQVRRARV